MLANQIAECHHYERRLVVVVWPKQATEQRLMYCDPPRRMCHSCQSRQIICVNNRRQKIHRLTELRSFTGYCCASMYIHSLFGSNKTTICQRQGLNYQITWRRIHRFRALDIVKVAGALRKRLRTSARETKSRRHISHSKMQNINNFPSLASRTS